MNQVADSVPRLAQSLRHPPRKLRGKCSGPKQSQSKPPHQPKTPSAASESPFPPSIPRIILTERTQFNPAHCSGGRPPREHSASSSYHLPSMEDSSPRGLAPLAGPAIPQVPVAPPP